MGVFQKQGTWWIDWYEGGRRRRKKTRARNKTEARKLLQRTKQVVTTVKINSGTMKYYEALRKYGEAKGFSYNKLMNNGSYQDIGVYMIAGASRSRPRDSVFASIPEGYEPVADLRRHRPKSQSKGLRTFAEFLVPHPCIVFKTSWTFCGHGVVVRRLVIPEWMGIRCCGTIEDCVKKEFDLAHAWRVALWHLNGGGLRKLPSA